MNDILFNKHLLSIYCDCSAVKDHNLIGVSACYVGDGSTIVKNNKVYLKQESENVLAELLAISYALEQLPSIIGKYVFLLEKPRKAIVFSDYKPIEGLLVKHNFKKQSYTDAIEQIQSTMQKLTESYKWLEVKVQYLGEEKFQHIFYKACHKAARNVIGKKIRRK